MFKEWERAARKSGVECRFLLGRSDRLDLAARLSAYQGICRDSCEIAVPSVRAADDAFSCLVDPVLDLFVIGAVEADEAVRIDRLRDLCVLAVRRIERLRHLDDAILRRRPGS